MAPETIRYEIGLYGKPRVANAPADIRFSLAHSGDRALIAVAFGREVGVDIEEHQPVDAMGLAKTVFSPAERGALGALDAAWRVEAFYRLWTRKESFVKARGDGLSCPLDAFDVSLDEDGPQLLIACRGAAADHRTWTLVNIRDAPRYSAALTVEGDGRHTNIRVDGGLL
jgi:4'-phosphopantetheinyl transferase